MKTYTPQIMQKAEQYLFEQKGVSPLALMQKAAASVFFAVRSRLRPYDTIAVLCGKGNNAGDGYEVARLMRKDGKNVICIDVLGGEPTVEPALTCYNAYIAEGGKVVSDPKTALKKIAFSTVIFDAVFGIGFRGVIEKDSFLHKCIDAANLSGAFRVAIDVPSGVRSVDGSVGGIAFAADLTVTVTALKIGMLSYPARFFCGRTEVVDIGVPPEVLNFYKEENPGFAPDDDYVAQALPMRPEISNKGDFGKLACVCGSENMTGAAVLSVGAALRAGAGLVTLASDFFQFIQRIHVCHDAISNHYFQVCTTPPCTQVRCLCWKLLSATVLFQFLLHVVYGAFLYRFALQIFLGRLALYDFASIRLAPFNRFAGSYPVQLPEKSVYSP